MFTLFTYLKLFGWKLFPVSQGCCATGMSLLKFQRKNERELDKYRTIFLLRLLQYVHCHFYYANCAQSGWSELRILSALAV